MGDQSLGRLIKKRRDALGFSQARLGELVGRSASTIRNWERGKSTPANRSDAVALAAVLGLEEGEVLVRAGFDDAGPDHHQTVEQAYASLAPEVKAPTPEEEASPEDGEPEVEPPPIEPPSPEANEPVPPAEDPVRPGEAPAASEPEPPAPPVDERPRRERRADRPWEPSVRQSTEDRPRRLVAVPPVPDEAPAAEEREVARAARPTVLEMAPAEEKSYIEDPEERQRYRARAVWTGIVIIFLAIVLIWSFDRATDALGDMWSHFVDLLEI